MRGQETPVPWLVKAVGVILIVGLPVAVVAEVHLRVRIVNTPGDFALLFLLTAAGGQMGLVVRRWGRISMGRLLLDLALALVAGLVSYGVADLAVRRGGGQIDPSLVAVLLAYVLTIWSGQQR